MAGGGPITETHTHRERERERWYREAAAKEEKHKTPVNK